MLRKTSLLALVALAITACGDPPVSGVDPDAGEPDAGRDASPPTPTLDEQLSALIERHSLTGDPATPRGRAQVRPSEDSLAKLGQMLFFSQTLAGSFDASCATCHLMDKGASDDLSISIGVVPKDRNAVGLAREIDADRDLHSLADGGPNMSRNSITTFNVGLFDRALMWDGRIRVGEWQDEVVPGGAGQQIVTPESGPTGDYSGVVGLLEAVNKFPITNDVEMRGFLYSNLSHPDQFRVHLMERLKGNVDQFWMREDSAQNWLALFREGFGEPEGTADELITLLNMQRALGRFLESQIFVDTPLREYIEGDRSALSDEAKRGAVRFLTPIEEGGLGCASCHAGDRFTNERFFNVGFPQIGRGLRSDRKDLGHWTVTRRDTDRFAHRVPMLLNVALTAPYGHAGTFESLESVVRYHANPREAVEEFDFTLEHLPQFEEGEVTYPHAEPHTREAIGFFSFDEIAEPLLPNRALSDAEVAEVVAFLGALTDRCAADPGCVSDWVPAPEEDPDGHMLGGDGGPAPDVFDSGVPNPVDYPEEFEIEWPEVDPRATFADVVACVDGLDVAFNAEEPRFERRDLELGLTAPHSYAVELWEYEGAYTVEFIMMAGGLTATYLDDDCWPDLVFTGGSASGIVSYLNQGEQAGFVEAPGLLSGTLPQAEYVRFSGVGVADLNGDYRRELVFGNVLHGDVVLLTAGAGGVFEEVVRLPMMRNTYGISFGDYDGDGYSDLFFAHWDFRSVDGTAPALFRNQGGVSLRPSDWAAGTSTAYLDQSWNFTPKFVDLRGTGHADLVVSSDFGTSAVLRNTGSASYAVVTDREVITDDNGMGGALGDFDNDGDIDWFVTSILDPDGIAEANWGTTGNRLYVNESTPEEIVFVDGTEQAGVRDGNWGWGACMADFDNDGFLDVFHVNGFGMVPEETAVYDWHEAYLTLAAEFIGTHPHLFLNQGDGTFVDATEAWGIDVPSEGRGVVCFDYDRDGDVDIALFDHSTGIQFFENQIGHGAGRSFLNVRLVGAPPNTEAVGAKVYATADVGGAHGAQRQMRISETNSNFNSQNPPDLHFGFGDAQSVDYLRVEWTDGTGLICADVETNRFLVFDQRDTEWPKADPEAPDCTWHADVSAVTIDLPSP